MKVNMMTNALIYSDAHVVSSPTLPLHVGRQVTKPYEDTFANKGQEILKRVVFYVPATGPGSIDRNIKSCKTLKGSKPYRQFTDVGIPGVSTFASGVAMSVQAAEVLLHVLHALIRTAVVARSALNLSRNQYRSVA